MPSRLQQNPSEDVSIRRHPMPMVDLIATGPILSLLTAIVAALASLAGFTSSLGLTPVQSDIATTFVFIGLALYWTRLAFGVAPVPRAAGFGSAQIDSWTSRLLRRLPHLVISLIFLAAGGWFAWPVAELAAAPRWKVCGTLAGSCSASFCATGLDFRSRPISQDCVRARDISGYLEIEPEGALRYRPRFLRLQCGGKDLSLQLPAAFHSAKCDATLEFP